MQTLSLLSSRRTERGRHPERYSARTVHSVVQCGPATFCAHAPKRRAIPGYVADGWARCYRELALYGRAPLDASLFAPFNGSRV